MMDHMMGYGYWGWLWGTIILIGIGVFIYLAANGKFKEESYGEETALDVLKKRYAKGDISKDEFEQMKKDIEG